MNKAMLYTTGIMMVESLIFGRIKKVLCKMSNYPDIVVVPYIKDGTEGASISFPIKGH